MLYWCSRALDETPASAIEELDHGIFAESRAKPLRPNGGKKVDDAGHCQNATTSDSARPDW
jgi:hypothetical protein